MDFKRGGSVSTNSSDCYLPQNEQLFSYTMTTTSYIQWNDDNDDDVCFVLDQHA